MEDAMAWFRRKCYRNRAHHRRADPYRATIVCMWGLSVLVCCLRIIKKERG